MPGVLLACAMVLLAAGPAPGVAQPLTGVPGASGVPGVTPAIAAAPSGLASFAPALSRGLAATVGVYGVGRPVLSLEGLSGDASTRADKPPGGRDPIQASIGAGFVIDAQGLVVTSAHVVLGSDEIVVQLADRRVAAAQLVGADEETDIALLRVPLDLPPPAPQGHSTRLSTGDWVLAVGEPFGLHRSVTAGIVGGLDRHVAEEPELVFIQTDLALNPGNSGGPLLDSTGAVVGMNARMMVGSLGGIGVSMSVPIELVQQIVEELRRDGSVKRPRLGAVFHDVFPPEALSAGRVRASGAMVSSRGSESAAARLGIEAGDIVVGMNGRPVANSADLAHILLSWRTTDDTRVTVLRAGRFLELRMR